LPSPNNRIYESKNAGTKKQRVTGIWLSQKKCKLEMLKYKCCEVRCPPSIVEKRGRTDTR